MVSTAGRRGSFATPEVCQRWEIMSSRQLSHCRNFANNRECEQVARNRKPGGIIALSIRSAAEPFGRDYAIGGTNPY